MATAAGPTGAGDDAARSDFQKVLARIAGFLVVAGGLLGLLALVAFAWTTDSASQPGWATFGIGLGVMCAAAAVGTILGFLFGIPRSLQGGAANAAEGAGAYGPNTNLEQISDWLTKILVGVGLVEIGNASTPARELVHAVGEALGNTAAARALAAALMTLFVIGGFLTSYILTRTWVTRTFHDSDLDLVAKQAAVIATGTVQTTLDARASADAGALALVDRALDPPPGTPPPSQQELSAAVGAAADTARVLVFRRARQQRQESWRNDKDKLALTIPVFRALIDADTRGEYHRNHGQLGFALKDTQPPDWQGALAALDEAIRRRGPAERGWLYYEFNRALCRIALDPAQQGASADDVRTAVLDDVALVRRDPKLYRLLVAEPAMAAWAARNGVPLQP